MGALSEQQKRRKPPQKRGRGRPRVSADVLTKALAECERAQGQYYQAGRYVWTNYREVALKYGIGESTLRRYLAAPEYRATRSRQVLKNRLSRATEWDPEGDESVSEQQVSG